MGISKIEEHGEGCGEDFLGREAGGSWRVQRGEKVAERIQCFLAGFAPVIVLQSPIQDIS